MTTPMPPDDAPEHVLCKWWRDEWIELTREQLSGLTGYSVSSIRDFELGEKEIDPNVRKRYRLACAAVAMGIDFDWLTTRLHIMRPVTITMEADRK
ncbi:helix-turn-helix domain-containing protein [Rhizobium leguminosarum]|uniref:helix-turn-helix domain-containing protein n=1 Tax=Rhizobium leguminosarum TaxID=384 RepID=UPI0017CC2219|nr:helix-turn-helix transcriptional regulator [Rhizobium leguminosarum]MBB4342133.1 hypothetical protein [Rhizobium leguminosarum]MBB6294757.1 hypothetical protein [Rhizobium leguminosarum]